MAKQIKKAEIALIDADRFPIESFRERLARKYGLDAVALSGPCEGLPLVDCVVNQLSKRWDRIKDRFAGNQQKINKLAIKLAESYMRKDDTEKCVKDLEALGYSKEASNGISSFLKAYAMDPAADMDMNNAMNAVEQDPMAGMDAPEADPMDDMGGDPMGGADPAAELQAPMGDEMPMEGGDMGGVAPADDGMGGGDTVTIELPMDVAQQVAQAVEQAEGGQDGGMGLAGEEPGLDAGFDGGGDLGMSGEEPGLDLEVVDMDGNGDPSEGMPGGDPHGDAEIVPGEPADGAADHEVETESAGMGGHDAGKCQACGHSMASEGNHGKETSAIETLLRGVQELTSHEGKEQSGEQSPPAHEKAEEKTINKMDNSLDKFKSEDKGGDDNGHDNGDGEEKSEKKDEAFAKAAMSAKMASLNMRKGHIRSQKSVIAESILRLGPEMSINNTDQLGGHDDKKLGDAKNKTPDEPKPISDGNVELEGYSAGEKKYQDGATMGHEEKFDAKPFDKGCSTGGKSSIMGKDESFPEGKPQVPAGSAPIGGEEWTGGDLSTKGTVIATITPQGVLVEANGKKFIAKAEIKQAMVEKIHAGLSKIAFNGDGRAYAEAAFMVIKQAEESGKVDNVTKIDTSKLEAEKFTNNADKKPEEGGAMTGKGSGGDYQNEGVTKTDTSKKEDEHFTNDGEKKADDDTTKAAAAKEIKTAKPVEEPKPIADGNLTTEGYSAGDKKFQDNKTLGHEEKFDAKTVDKSEVSKGSASEIGKDEEFPTGKPDVPAGGGKMGKEEWDGGDLSTKGTTIAENQSTKRQASAELESMKNEFVIREARLKAAGIYVADLLRHQEISESEYNKEVEKVAAMSVPAIQNLIAQAKLLRSRVAASAAVTHSAEKQEGKVAGLAIPIVVTASKNESSLKDRLVREFKLTRTLDQIDDMKK